jgi:hypothetical protein
MAVDVKELGDRGPGVGVARARERATPPAQCQRMLWAAA